VDMDEFDCMVERTLTFGPTHHQVQVRMLYLESLPFCDAVSQHSFKAVLAYTMVMMMMLWIHKQAAFADDVDLTGCMLWPTSSVLAEWLIDQAASLSDARVIELGAGCGMWQ